MLKFMHFIENSKSFDDNIGNLNNIVEPQMYII